MDWWVTHGSRVPIGPVTTELLLKGIGAGMIPREALICEVGGETWKPILKVPPFSIAFDSRHSRRGVDAEDERTIADAPDQALSRFDEVVEHTIVDRRQRISSIPPPLGRLERFGDADEKTIADAVPVAPKKRKDD